MVHVQLVLVLQRGTVAQVVLFGQIAARLAGRAAHAAGLGRRERERERARLERRLERG